MVKIKPLDEISKKWGEVTPGRAPYFQAGVQSADVDWAGPAAGAATNWFQGLQTANTKGLFAKGVREAGTEKWRKKALTPGVTRFSEGVPLAVDDHRKGFEKYHGVISGLTLPAKGPRGAAGNYARSKAIGDALFKARTGASPS